MLLRKSFHREEFFYSFEKIVTIIISDLNVKEGEREDGERRRRERGGTSDKRKQKRALIVIYESCFYCHACNFSLLSKSQTLQPFSNLWIRELCILIFFFFWVRERVGGGHLGLCPFFKSNSHLGAPVSKRPTV